jgi:uncharacterized protein (TIGR01244 family)
MTKKCGNLVLIMVGLFAVVSLIGCKSPCACCEDPGAEAAKTPAVLESATCGAIQRLHVYDKVYLGSMVTQADLAEAKALGVGSIVNLRGAAEHPDFKEKEAAEALGLTYYNPAFQSTESLTNEKIAEIIQVLKDAEKPTLLHCGSANRVGAVWIAYRTEVLGADVTTAVDEAKTIGLKSPDYERRVLEYLREKK